MSALPPDAADPFDTAGIRARVVEAWTAAPARFREDANAEEDYALGGYRDRLVVELAQNAADAATAAGVPGRVRFTLTAGELRVANAGAPLDAAGVESLSTLRASAKRDGATAGRFGVGFAAVLAVTDEPRVVSRSGGVAWSRSATREVVAGVPGLAGELAGREGHVPALRLPYADVGEPGGDADTEVILPLRDDAAREYVRRLLAGTGPALLLGLPALREVRIEVDEVVRELRAEWDDQGETVDVTDDGATTRWRLSSATGELAPELLADRPVEERARPSWTVRWAVPVDADGRPEALPGGVDPVLHAPTPSDEPVGLPALLLASFPLDPARRHIAAGPLTDFLVGRAGEAYAALLPALPPSTELLALVPDPVPTGVLDGALRQAIHRSLRDRAFLPTAEDGPRVVARDAVAADVPAGLVEVLAEVLPGLLPAEWAVRRAPLRWLEVRQLTLADVVELLGTLRREPAWWHRVYAELASAEREPLAALPVPLADGRTVRGPRGLLLGTPDVDGGALGALGVRVVAAEAVHPLLGRLGAIEATPRAVLDDPHVRAAVAGSYDADDPDTVANAVLPAVAAATFDPGDESWLGALALRDGDGEVRSADELLIPGGPLARVVVDDAPFGVVAADLVDRWGAETLERVGVLSTFAVVRDEDVPLDPDECDHDLDAEDEWVEATLAAVGDGDDVPPVAAELVAVRDLDLVASDRWEEALGLFADPRLRAALVGPVTVLSAGGRRTLAPSYTAWWLRTRPVLDGRRPADLRVAGLDERLAGLYDETSAGDPVVLAALGVRTTLDDLLAEPDGPADLLDRLADPAREVSSAALDAVYVAVADTDTDAELDPPERLRVARGDATEVVRAADVVVVDRPDLLPLLDDRPSLVVRSDLAERLASRLDLALAGDVVAGRIESAYDREPVPELVRAVLPAAPDTYLAHDPLVVDGRTVDWRYADGEVHASSLAGLARGLSWAADRWEQRHLVAALLDDPASADRLLAEARLDR